MTVDRSATGYTYLKPVAWQRRERKRFSFAMLPLPVKLPEEFESDKNTWLIIGVN